MPADLARQQLVERGQLTIAVDDRILPYLTLRIPANGNYVNIKLVYEVCARFGQVCCTCN